MKTRIRSIGNSQGVFLPKPLLAQVGLSEGEVEMTVEGDTIVLRSPKEKVRAGWARAAKRLASYGDDTLLWPQVENEADASLAW